MIVIFSLGVPVLVMMQTAVLSTDDCCFQSWSSSYCYDANCCSLNEMIVIFSLSVPVIVMMQTAVLSTDDCCFQSWCARV